VRHHNVLQPFGEGLEPFDSIGIMNLLHCLPGDMETKSVVLENTREMLNPGGVLFGSTIIYRKGWRNPLTAAALAFNNWRGIMTNRDDDVEVLNDNLGRLFRESGLRIIGCEVLFWARK
ncbi:MAG: methyltransferase type 12, partial [Chloroflexota bacterium]